MLLLRSLLFNIFLYAGIVSVFLIALPALFLPPKFTLLFGKLLGYYVIFVVRIFLNTKVEIKGISNIPKAEKYFVASAHQSMFETFALQAVLDYPVFILKKELLKKGYIVYLTRDGDYFIPLKERTHFANMKKADLFISIHCNIAPKHLKSPNGIETYFLSPTRNERAIQVARLENKEIKNLNYLDQRVILNFLNKDRIIDSHKLAIDIQNCMLK